MPEECFKIMHGDANKLKLCLNDIAAIEMNEFLKIFLLVVQIKSRKNCAIHFTSA